MIEQSKKILQYSTLYNSILIYGSKGIGKSYIVESVIKELSTVSLDVLNIIPSSIEEVRNAINFSIMKPFGLRKVLVLKNIENLSINAINAILKLIEEPPLYLNIFLITCNIYALPKTIISRCIKIPVTKPPLKEFIQIIRQYRQDISENIIQYLYDVLNADINATKTIKNDIVSFITNNILNDDFKQNMQFNFNEKLSTNDDDNNILIKILLFELLKKAKNTNNVNESIDIFNKIKLINDQYSKIQQHNLSESNVMDYIWNVINTYYNKKDQ